MISDNKISERTNYILVREVRKDIKRFFLNQILVNFQTEYYRVFTWSLNTKFVVRTVAQK